MHPAKTKNPWNARHTPGGSSSGSAAAVAAGHVAGAHRDADQRLGDPAGRVLRRRRVQADARMRSRSTASISSARRSTSSARSRGSVADAARLASALADARRSLRYRRRCEAAAARLSRRLSLDARSTAMPTTRSTPRRRRCAGTARTSSPSRFPAQWREANRRAPDDHAVRGARNLGALQDRDRARLSPTLNAALDEGRAIADVRLRRRAGSAWPLIAVVADWLA